MKTVLLISLSILGFGALAAQPPSKKAEAFTNTFLSALKEKDFKKIEPLIATAEDYKAMQGMPMPGNTADSAKIKTGEKFKKYFNELLEISKGSQLDWTAMKIDSAHESGSGTPKVKFTVWLSQAKPERHIGLEFKKAMDVNGAFKLHPSSGMGLEGNDPVNIIIARAMEALKNKDSIYFAKSLVPSKDDFRKLIDVVYAGNEEMKKMDNNWAASMITSKTDASLWNAMEQMKKEKIDPGALKLSYGGRSIERHDEGYTTFYIAMNLLLGEKRYRLNINYCSWLNENPYVFVLGEVEWKGEQ